MRIAICDDFLADVEIVKSIFKNHPLAKDCEITSYTQSEEMLSAVENGEQFDIAFLDIDMPKINGLELGLKLKLKFPDIFIVFFTNYPQYAVDAFDCEAFHYLLKPLDVEKASKTIDRLYQRYKEKNKYYVIKTKNGSIRVPIKDIYYIESSQRHIIYHLKDKSYDTLGRMSDVLSDLKDYGFYQVHQGYIVNMDLISHFEKNDAVLTDGRKVMISVRKRTEVLLEYTKYIERSL